ncbi:MAG: hypothetical protein FWG38_07925 [Defluviitaleaceae bacterium]|nr:hypothetical protein [Defluviitaleaceae bacterium]
MKAPEIPKAFIHHDKAKHVLYHVIEGFNYEEQMAIGVYYFLNLSISEIAQVTGLSKERVTNVISLYAARLEDKLSLFRKALPYNENDVLQVSDILFQEVS